jgi:hypothetical protein
MRIQLMSFEDNLRLVSNYTRRIAWFLAFAGFIGAFTLFIDAPAVASQAENSVVLPGTCLSFPSPAGGEKIKRRSPHYDEQSQKLFVIETGQLVAYQIEGRSLGKRAVISAVDDFAVWKIHNRTVIVALREQVISVASLEGMTIQRIPIDLGDSRFGSFSNGDASIPVVGRIQGEFRFGMLTETFEFKPVAVTLANGWVAIGSQRPDTFCFPASVNSQLPTDQRQPPMNCAVLNDEFVVSLIHSLPRLFVPFSTVSSPSSDISTRLLGVQFDEKLTLRRVRLWSPDESQARFLTPASWDCYGPVASPSMPECIGFQRTITRTTNPLSKVDVYSRSELCLVLNDTVVVLSPCSGGDGSDWKWSTSGTTIVMLGPDLQSDWSGAEVVTFFEVR